MRAKVVNIVCQILVLVVIGLNFATGAFFLVCAEKQLMKPVSILKTYTSIYFTAGSFSLLITLTSLILVVRHPGHGQAFLCFITLAQSCLQTGVAVFSACYGTNVDESLRRTTVTLGIKKYLYTWTDLIRWHNIYSFTVALPALAILFQCRWAAWAERARKQEIESDVVGKQSKQSKGALRKALN